MAKRRARRVSTGLDATAENIGAALGHLAARVSALNRQRAEVAADIKKYLQIVERSFSNAAEETGKRASALLSSASASPNKGGRPKGYKMSEATKRKLRAAWKRRKAAMAASKTGNKDKKE